MSVTFGVDKTAALLPAELLARHSALLDKGSEGEAGLLFEDPVRAVACFLPAIHTYRHLGGILTSDSNPSPDLHFRFSQCMGVVRPLRRKLFGALKFDLPVRRTLLRSLAVSKYVHTAAALSLHATLHRRHWERQYLSIWRVLVARHAVDTQVHSYEVLRCAQAPHPALALATARASCLRKLFDVGPYPLVALLWDHWRVRSQGAWLSQLEEDVRHVAVYCPNVLNCLGSPPYTPALLEAFSSEPSWWPSQVKSAIVHFLKDLDKWKESRHTAPTRPLREVDHTAFACYLCSRAFPLRKHLHAHLARTHHVYSPARHFAISEVCQGCLRQYSDVVQAQQHLKRSPGCLLHCLRSFRPLTIEEIRVLEAPVRASAQAIRKGKWQVYQAKGPPRRVPVVYGPRIPTGQDRLDGRTPGDDDAQVFLAQLGRPFQPLAAHTVWVQDFVNGSSKEGARATCRPFWLARPFHPEFNACSFGKRLPAPQQEA